MGIDCRSQKVNQSDQFKVVADQHESDLFLGGHCPQFDKCRYVIVTFAQKKPQKMLRMFWLNSLPKFQINFMELVVALVEHLL